MKSRLFITLLMMALTVSSVHAQKEKRFEIAAQAGIGTTWIINQMNYGLTEMEYDYFWGNSLNLQVGYNFTENIGLYTEIGTTTQGQNYFDTWTYKGYPFPDDKSKYGIKRNVTMSYLNVPVLFKYTYGDTRARFRVLIGPQFSFLQSAEQEYTYDDNKDMMGLEELTNNDGESFDPAAHDIKDRFNNLNIPLVLDLGADIYLLEGVMYFSAAVRLSYSLTDMNADAYQMENRSGVYDASKNASVMFMSGLHYVIGGKKVVESR